MGDREGTQGRGVWRIKGVEEEEEDERWGRGGGERMEGDGAGEGGEGRWKLEKTLCPVPALMHGSRVKGP